MAAVTWWDQFSVGSKDELMVSWMESWSCWSCWSIKNPSFTHESEQLSNQQHFPDDSGQVAANQLSLFQCMLLLVRLFIWKFSWDDVLQYLQYLQLKQHLAAVGTAFNHFESGGLRKNKGEGLASWLAADPSNAFGRLKREPPVCCDVDTLQGGKADPPLILEMAMPETIQSTGWKTVSAISDYIRSQNPILTKFDQIQ